MRPFKVGSKVTTVPAPVVAIRQAQQVPVLNNAYNTLTNVGQSLATLAAAYGANIEDAEKHLGLLVDQALVTRTVGSRATALYALA